MAAVWGQKSLREIRCKTAKFASDIEQLVSELCDWVMKEGRTTIEKEHLQVQQKLISVLTKQINTVGREAVEELRSTVKTKLS